LHVRGIRVSWPVMKPYSQDLRERIIRELEAQAETQPEIAEQFAVSLSFVEKLWRRWRTTGSCTARPHAGGRHRRLQAAAAVMRAALARAAALTLAARCEQVEPAGGPQVSEKTRCRELQRLQLPRKRSPSMRVSGRRRG
jgi:transposase